MSSSEIKLADTERLQEALPYTFVTGVSREHRRALIRRDDEIVGLLDVARSTVATGDPDRTDALIALAIGRLSRDRYQLITGETWPPKGE